MTSIKGKVHQIGATVQVSDSFKKRTLILDITDNPTYPNFHQFEFIQDKVDLLNGLELGQAIELHYNLRGRKWVNKDGETKFFNTTEGWKIEGQAAASTPQQEPQHIPDTDEDGLPF
jgi:hypothetical protein